ncbi:hypothetical protein [[Clostridium] fimetarium]|nr:hypothetical protein [[Clostridium] fimetarium]
MRQNLRIWCNNWCKNGVEKRGGKSQKFGDLTGFENEEFTLTTSYEK